MNAHFLIAAIFLPFVGGLLLYPLKKLSFRAVKLYTAAITLLTSVLVWTLILTCSANAVELIRFADNLVLRLRFDGLGRFFAGIIATLWPLTVLYGFSYMEHEERLTTFFEFFTVAFGVTLGISMSANLFTMYCFYELLTLSTVPLVIHKLDRQSVRAARTYFVFSIGGAAFAFAAMVFLLANGISGDFSFGGLLTEHPYGKQSTTLIFYLLGFLGFGVKAAVFPTDYWLPKASVAPTPVTALLHAVAVVKSGVFAIIRLTYFAFGTSLLKGTWVQTVVMCFAVFTMFYGATRAVKESHWKRRLAYSTVANLSYILFGVTMMTAEGLSAGLLHMAFHAEIKILAFFCAGAVLHKTGREYIYELDGLGKKMPVTFACFTVSALALVGIPPFSGFVSKWYLLTAAASSENILAYIGAGVLLLAALLTAIYMFTTVRRAWFPDSDTDLSSLADVREAGWRMTVPMVILATATLLTGLFAQPIVNEISAIIR